MIERERGLIDAQNFQFRETFLLEIEPTKYIFFSHVIVMVSLVVALFIIQVSFFRSKGIKNAIHRTVRGQIRHDGGVASFFRSF